MHLFQLTGNGAEFVNVLLARNAEQGNEKKPFCDGLVYECIAIAEDMLYQAGKI